MANNEWRTPSRYVESARKVMGSIDLDPASNDEAQKVVKAKNYCTIDYGDKTFKFAWEGNIWLNPPYGRGMASPFVKKVCDDYLIGFTEQAIILTNNVPDTDWWSSTLGQTCTAICQPDHRIAFINPETGKPERGNDRNQMFCYLGNDVAAFVAEYSQYGLCSTPWRIA